MDPSAPELPSLADYLNRPPWMGQGACRGMDTSQFVTERATSTADAKAVCRSCPVVGECLAFALGHLELRGVWGGTSQRERRAMRREVA